MLQEWLLTQTGGVGGSGSGPGVVAAGIVNVNGPTTRAVLNGLKVVKSVAAGAAWSVFLAFGGYAVPPSVGGPQYVVKALPWSALLPNLTVTFAGFLPDGMVLLISKGGAAFTGPELKDLQLMVEVTQVG